MMFNPALDIWQPRPVSDHTYTLHSEDGQQLAFRTDYKPDTLIELQEGEKLDQTIQVTGNFEQVEKDNQKAYMIREAEVEINTTK